MSNNSDLDKQQKSTFRPRLARELGPIMAIAVVVGTVIGSGIFQKPQQVAANVPYFGLTALVWILGGVLALLGAIALAEVAAMFPRAGGNYVFLREGYGRWAGFLWGWVEFFIIRGAALAALATLFARSLNAMVSDIVGTPVFGYWGERGVTIAVILGLAAVNARGVKWGGWLNLCVTSVKVGSLLFIMVLPFAAVALFSQATAAPDVSRLAPVWPNWSEVGFPLVGGFATALLAVLWAYHGWMNITPIAEEVKQPQRNIPLALVSGVGILIALYLGTNFAYSLVLTTDEMSQMKEQPVEQRQAIISAGFFGMAVSPHEHAPIVAAAGAFPKRENYAFTDKTVAIGFCRRLIGPIGASLAALAVMCSVFGAINGILLVGPRLLYAMGEDRLAPRMLGEVHARYRTPVIAIFVMAGWASLLVAGIAFLTSVRVLPADKDHFNFLTNFAMFGAVIFETMAVLSIFIFRWRLPDADRPYRCWGYPIVPMLYALLPAMVLGNMFFNQQYEAVGGVAFIVVGVLVYVFVDLRHLKWR